jgi:hypothetical protein
MEAYQERVVVEKEQLDEKIKKLEDFIFRTTKFFDVPDDERLRLVKQYGYMKDYSSILGQRIANFKTTPRTTVF